MRQLGRWARAAVTAKPIPLAGSNCLLLLVLGCWSRCTVLTPSSDDGYLGSFCCNFTHVRRPYQPRTFWVFGITGIPLLRIISGLVKVNRADTPLRVQHMAWTRDIVALQSDNIIHQWDAPRSNVIDIVWGHMLHFSAVVHVASCFFTSQIRVHWAWLLTSDIHTSLGLDEL